MYPIVKENFLIPRWLTISLDFLYKNTALAYQTLTSLKSMWGLEHDWLLANDVSNLSRF
jgi:hypothetical protein